MSQDVPVLLSDPVQDKRIQRLLDQFAVDPADTPAFETLEEHLFLSGAWSRLAGVYECRLSAFPEADPHALDVRLRLAEVLMTRLEDPPAARRRLEEVLQIEPRSPRALAALRRLLAAGGDAGGALQISEMEEALQLGSAERAALLAETGALWLELGDREEAERRFREGVELDPRCDAAARGFAALAEADGRVAEAVAIHERRARELAGSARADVLEHVAQLVEDEAPGRARELLHAVVREFPERRPALERLIGLERDAGESKRVDGLQRTLWRCLRDDEERMQLALEAATGQLADGGDAEAALHWIQQAHELRPDSLRVQELRARVCRRAGQSEGLLDALERLVRLSSAADAGLHMLEIAALHDRAGRSDEAADWLRQRLAVLPDDEEALALLDRCLARSAAHPERAQVLERRAALTSGSARVDILADLGALHAEHLDDPDAAEQAYRRALELAPEHGPAGESLAALLRAAGRDAELAELLDTRLATLQGDARIQLACQLGDLHLDALGDAAAAAAAFRLALDSDPTAADALAGLQRVAQSTGDAALRIEVCERRLRLTHEPAARGALLAELGETARAAGDLPRARAALRERADLEPELPAAWIACAELARAAGDARGEASALDRLAEVLGDAPARRALVLVRRGEVALEGADDDPIDAAIEAWSGAAALATSDALWDRLADLYRRSDRTAELVDALRARLEAPAAGPEQRPLRLELARTLSDLGRCDEAVEALRPALDADPGDAEIGDALEELLTRSGDAEARAELLGTRLARERETDARRALAERLAELLLDRLDRPDDAVSVLRELADPSRDDSLEKLFDLALSAADMGAERISWLASCEVHLEGPRRVALLLELARLRDAAGDPSGAIDALQRAQRDAGPRDVEAIRTRLLDLLRRHGDPAQQVAYLDQVLEQQALAPGARAALRIERARLLAEDLDRPQDALDDLERAQRDAPVGPAELHLVASLAARTGAGQRRVQALQQLAERTENAAEARLARLELVTLFCDGDAEVRDTAAAIEVLQHLLERDPDDGEAFDRLAALLADGQHPGALIELLRTRLEASDERPAEQRALALRLARMHLAAGEPRQALGLLDRWLPSSAPDEPVDELRHQALRRAGEHDALRELCETRASTDPGSGSSLWARRWLAALHDAGASTTDRLRALETLLRHDRSDPALHAERVALVRAGDDPHARVEALEVALEADAGGARSAAWTRELIDLLAGPLDRPELALRRIEMLAADDAELTLRGAGLAARLGDADREADLLRPLALPADAPARHVRRCAEALLRGGREDEAEPLLWRALEHAPGDAALLDALEPRVRAREDRGALLGLLEARWSAADAAARPGLAREACELADGLEQADARLSWLRRLGEVDAHDAQTLGRWIDLERARGDRAGRLAALAHVERFPDAPARADWLAERADVLSAAGQTALAADAWRAAIEASPRPPVEWLGVLEQLCDRLGARSERIDLLRELASRVELPLAEREAHAERAIELLASDPACREEAALELARLLGDSDDPLDPEQDARERHLMDLYLELGRDTEWCQVAERRLAREDLPQRAALERALARRQTRPLADRPAAIQSWERVLAGAPGDAEALAALSELLRAPGREPRLSEVLELRATASAGADAAAAWLEAARVRWNSLGDAAAALDDVDRALELDPELRGAHDLRAELCWRAGRPVDEAASLRSLLGADPAGPHAARQWMRLARLTLEIDGRADEALALARRARRLAPADPELEREAAPILEAAAAWAEALELLHERAASAGDEQLPELLRRISEIAWDECHDASAADEALEALAEIDALDGSDHARWAEVRDALGDTGGALRERRAALESAGSAAPATEWLALARALTSTRTDAIDDDELATAREACDRAVSIDPGCLEALELRADLLAELDAPGSELEDRLRIAEMHASGEPSARAWSRAAELAQHALGDAARAWMLHRSALKACADWVPSLLGAGRIALERGDWAEAEELLGAACARLPADGPDALSRVAHEAARAAEAGGRNSEAFTHLERGLSGDPHDPELLEALATLALRTGAHGRAIECLERRLEDASLVGAARAEILVRLAQATEGDAQLERASAALIEALELVPDDEVRRARLVDLLERKGEPARALEQLDAWMAFAPHEDVARLQVRAARMALDAGDREDARRRLEQTTQHSDAPGAAWCELAELVLGDGDATEVLHVLDRAREAGVSGPDAAALAWMRSRALVEMGRTRDATAAAREALGLDPARIEAARMLAANLGHVDDWAAAAEQIERALEVSRPEPAIEAELWESLGRAYAGPLEDIERAQRCYRRALDANPRRSSAREALADIAAFDPGHHAEAIELHRSLLEDFPARPGSWRSLARIADHWSREAAIRGCSRVLEALGADLDPSNTPASGPMPVDTAPASSPALLAADEILRALAEADQLPSPGPERRFEDAPGPLRREIIALAGAAWDLDDDDVRAVWRGAIDRSADETLQRRARRRVRRAIDAADAEQLAALAPADWRADVAGRAAAQVLASGEVELRELLLALLGCWPDTRQLDLRNGGELAAAIQACAPARALMLRVVDGTIQALGLT